MPMANSCFTRFGTTASLASDDVSRARCSLWRGMRRDFTLISSSATLASQMEATLKKALLAAACMAAYVVWPYMTLYRLRQALEQGNMPVLTEVISWHSVRDGLREDIVKSITGGTETQESDTSELPPFGSSFVRGMAGSELDRLLTPQQLAQAVQTETTMVSAPVLRSAWFTGPTSFEAAIRLTSDTQQTDVIRLRLELGGRGLLPHWRVTRAWVPANLIQQLAAN